MDESQHRELIHAALGTFGPVFQGHRTGIVGTAGADGGARPEPVVEPLKHYIIINVLGIKQAK